MSEEIKFQKYITRGADYHYKQINKCNLRKFNPFIQARYIKHINLIEKSLLNSNYKKSKAVNVLDVGCGDGVLLFLLKKKITDYKFNIHGIDLSDKAIETAKLKIPDGEFYKTSVYDSTFQNNYFDLVISSDVIEHVLSPEKMLSEIKRVSKNKALIIIGTPIRYTEKPLDKMHVKEFFQNEFVNLISKYFRNVFLTESHKLNYLLKYQKRRKIMGLKISFNRYIYYFMSIFLKNPFLKERKNKKELFAYMYAIAEK